MLKPRIFIGSSTEGLEIANAVQHNLEHFAEATVWTQDIFKLSVPVITNLIKSLSQFQFAIFIFSSDDISNIRGVNENTVRDNVIFETGLFAGRLGTEKVFLVKPRGFIIHLPSDMLGIVIGEYDSNRSDRNLIAATGTFCNQVKISINEIINKQEANQQISNNLEKDLHLIEVYLKDKGWAQMSFEKICADINPRFIESYLMKIVENFPEKVIRCKISSKYGIKLLGKINKDTLNQANEIGSYSPYTRLIISLEVSLTENFATISEKLHNFNGEFHLDNVTWETSTFEIHTSQYITSKSLIVYKLRDILKDYRLKTIEIYNSTKRV